MFINANILPSCRQYGAERQKLYVDFAEKVKVLHENENSFSAHLGIGSEKRVGELRLAAKAARLRDGHASGVQAEQDSAKADHESEVRTVLVLSSDEFESLSNFTSGFPHWTKPARLRGKPARLRIGRSRTTPARSRGMGYRNQNQIKNQIVSIQKLNNVS